MKREDKTKCKKKISYMIGGGVAALLIVGIFVWNLMPRFVSDPMVGIRERTAVRTWVDREGRPLYCERRWNNYEWRFDIPLTNIHPKVIEIMLCVEDVRFWEHKGIDYWAVLRAMYQNIKAGRIISGASTISMQVAGMDYHNGRRTFWEKLVQSAKVRKMEQLHTKEEILEAYFNNIPFGNNLFGIEAASRYYFGMPASEIGVVEASVLCGIPQRPNRYRPNRHPEAAKKRQKRVLNAMVRAGKMEQKEADRIFREERICYRDFRDLADFEYFRESKEWSFLLRQGMEIPIKKHDGMWPEEVMLSVDLEWCERIRMLLQNRVRLVEGVHDAAAVVLDAKNGEVLVYVGTLDFDSPEGGQVDAARAIRSAGSSLKPFIYEEAMRGGFITADSILLDAPVRYQTYLPKNYHNQFLGRVSATQALSLSLNTPVIRLLAELGEERMSKRFQELGLHRGQNVSTNGLSLALGTAGYRLIDIVKAYRQLVPGVAGGEDDREEGIRVMLAEMLRERALAGTRHAVAWKTGTSNNNYDAWCFGYTTDYVVGVWFGNKNGRRAEQIVGGEIAAPAVGEIFEMLYAKRLPPFWPELREKKQEVDLCFETGLTAGSMCRKKKGSVIQGIPLRMCSSCGEGRERLVILSPQPKTYKCNEGETHVRLLLQSRGEDVVWFVDGRMVESEGGKAEYFFGIGEHEVHVESMQPRIKGAHLALTVEDARAGEVRR